MELSNVKNISFYLLFGNLDDPYGKINLNIHEDFKDELKKITLSYVNKLNGNEFEVYNPIGSLDNIIEYIDLRDENNEYYVGFFNEKWFENINSIAFENDDDIEGYSSYIITAQTDSNDTIYLFRKPSKPISFKKRFILKKVAKQYVIDDEAKIVYDDKVDFLKYNDKIFIFNHNSMDTALNMTSYHHDNCNKIFLEKVISENITNFNDFKESVLNNKSHSKRVSKLSESDNRFLFLKNIKRTAEINEEYNLGLTFEENKLVFSDKSQTSTIIAFMQDAFYTTLLGEYFGVDKRR